MTKFKKGDVVRCVDAACSQERLERGRTYTVTDTYADVVYLENKFGIFNMVRFELATPASPVRTVTRREIVRQTIQTKEGCQIDVAPGVNINEVTLDIDPVWAWTSASIREAAALFNELADVLDENAREAA